MKDNNKNKDKILIVSGVIVCLAVIGFITWLLIGRIRQNKEDELLMQSNAAVNETEELSEENVEAPEEAPEETQVQPPQDDGTWTVMVYMCGTDLESKFACGTMNLYEMMLAKKWPPDSVPGGHNRQDPPA